ncbi:MAG: hypothetical protein Q9200_001218 [Gallowayella weberi]
MLLFRRSKGDPLYVYMNDMFANFAIFLLLLANASVSYAGPAGGAVRPGLGDIWADSPSCQQYSSCAIKGRNYWNALIARLHDPNAKDVNRVETFVHYYGTEHGDLDDPSSGQEVEQDLIDHGFSPRHGFTKWATFALDPLHRHPDHPAPYENMFSTKDGVIIATSNFRKADLIQKLFWSDIVYQNYLETVKPGESISALRTVIQTDVMNMGTFLVTKMAYEARGLDFIHDDNSHWLKWTLREQEHAFYSFLGTDNVKGVVHLLTDHSVAIGKKVVTEIWTRHDPQFDLWIEIGPHIP